MIINADDFGKSHACNLAITEAFDRGLINRTTIMVNMPCAEEALALAKDHGFLGCVGLHVNLTEGPALSDSCRRSSLCDEDGNLKGTFHISKWARLLPSPKLAGPIGAEIEAQMRRYGEMGFTLYHADSHNYVHTYPCVATEYNRLLQKYHFRSVRISRNIPEGDFSKLFGIYKTLYNRHIRKLDTGDGPIETTRYFGSVQDYEKFYRQSPDKDRDDVEIMTHPTYKDGVLWDDTLPEPHPFVDETWARSHGGYLYDFRKTKLLVTFIPTHIGGAMTSLVNFCNALDLNRYDVDLLFLRIGEGGRFGIKEGIHILPQAMIHRSYGIKNILKKAASPSYVLAKCREIFVRKVTHNDKKAVQIMARQGCRYSRRLTKRYDVAVSYEFSWCMYYTARFVQAEKKILWHHLDYAGAGLDFSLDKTTFDKYDRMVFVSSEIKDKFLTAHPAYVDKSLFLPNLLSSQFVRYRGEEQVEPVFAPTDKLRLVSLARIDFAHKGLDRGVRILAKLRDQGLAEGLRWVIIGKGDDQDKLVQMIAEHHLEAYVQWIGLKTNPIPYLKQAEVLFLPSLFEGKPMVVTEAQIVGVVPLVSRYASADEQIQTGVDGVVTDNSEEALYAGLRQLLEDKTKVEEMRAYILAHEYGNTQEIALFDKMLAEME